MYIECEANRPVKWKEVLLRRDIRTWYSDLHCKYQYIRNVVYMHACVYLDVYLSVVSPVHETETGKSCATHRHHTVPEYLTNKMTEMARLQHIFIGHYCWGRVLILEWVFPCISHLILYIEIENHL